MHKRGSYVMQGYDLLPALQQYMDRDENRVSDAVEAAQYNVDYGLVLRIRDAKPDPLPKGTQLGQLQLLASSASLDMYSYFTYKWIAGVRKVPVSQQLLY